MRTDLEAVLRHRAFNAWHLFWLVSAPMCLVMAVAASNTDLGTASGVSHMIQFSVRWAVPIIYLVLATSALQILFPGALSSWLLRNRKYVGFCFAVAMAWQGLFIFLMSNFHRDYYYEEVFYLRDELEGSTGYLFLAAMVATSFRPVRRYFNRQQWTLVHKTGLYFLWAYPFSVYWWNLYYYGNPLPIDYVFYWAGFLAFCLRIAAWGKQRAKLAARSGMTSASLPLKLTGALSIAAGVLVAATGMHWQKPATDFLLGPAWSAELVLWLPYWPFEPFLSLFMIGWGTLLITRSTASEALPQGA